MDPSDFLDQRRDVERYLIYERWMQITLVNHSKMPMARKWIQSWIGVLQTELKKSKIDLRKKSLTVVFLDPIPAKKMNQEFRSKNYATDILSFAGDQESLGELVICPAVLKKQAKEHDHSFKAELGYMLIHGVLHLLGYDHEKSKKEATLMFQIQDQTFDRLCQKFKL